MSKPFVFALICQAIGEDAAQSKLGVNSTGLPFNSVIALERINEGTNNPMVNAGAIATTSLAPGDTAEAKWQFIQVQLSRFAGRDLSLQYCSDKVQVGIRIETLSWGRTVPLPRWEGFRAGNFARGFFTTRGLLRPARGGMRCSANSVMSQLKKNPVREAERSERRAALDATPGHCR